VINDPYQIIVRPLITEKGTHQASALASYPFEVNAKANKTQIKQAVETIYNVRVLEVRTANRKGKPRRRGRFVSQTRNWKKAVVMLHEEDRIDLF
jgi:large subunit ribosomal protein L23